MKNLQHYLAESEKIHEFRVKFAVELDDAQLDKLETHLRKYDVFDITSPKRTILQSAPLDFYQHKPCEIYIIDFKTRLPMSPALATAELVQKLGIAERDIRLMNVNEPRELEIEKQAADKDKPSEARLLDSEYSEHENPNAEDYHGEKHLTKFMKELQDAKRETPTEYKLDEAPKD